MWVLPAVPGGSDSTKCQTLSLYQSLLSIWLDVQIKKSTSLKAGCKAWTSIPEKKRSALWYTAPTKWNFNEQKQNLISLLRKQMSLFFSCFNISLAQHLPFYSGTSSLRTEERPSVPLCTVFSPKMFGFVCFRKPLGKVCWGIKIYCSGFFFFGGKIVKFYLIEFGIVIRKLVAFGMW